MNPYIAVADRWEAEAKRWLKELEPYEDEDKDADLAAKNTARMVLLFAKELREVVVPGDAPLWALNLADQWKMRIAGIKASTGTAPERRDLLAYAIDSCLRDLLEKGCGIP